MLEAAREGGVQLMVGTMKRYDPAYERLLELLPDAGELRLIRVTTLESPFQPYVEGYPMEPPMPRAAGARRRASGRRRRAGWPRRCPMLTSRPAFCYRWMLLDNLVHELNALRGALGEPDVVKYAELSPRVRRTSASCSAGSSATCPGSTCPGIARYRQELAFYGLDRRLT